MPELRPCPFCGFPGILRRWNSGGPYDRKRWETTCSNTKCTNRMNIAEYKQQAIEAWNKRADKEAGL
ncbi:hypothetical protein FACS1894124_5110 [Spirochaetia bacterium]|nr:hypothetical protein FACS1894124_5110 [Spirochaetia bacterium]